MHLLNAIARVFGWTWMGCLALIAVAAPVLARLELRHEASWRDRDPELVQLPPHAVGGNLADPQPGNPLRTRFIST
jgi:hypothetical protein